MHNEMSDRVVGELGIHSAAWVPCRLGQAGVLASGGASGLVRIDILRERTFDLKKAGVGNVSDDGGENGDEDDELDEDWQGAVWSLV